MTCSTLGCKRVPRRTASGLVFAHCDAHTRLVLRDAFSASALAGSCPPWAGQRSSGHADPATRTASPLAVTKASPAH